MIDTDLRATQAREVGLGVIGAGAVRAVSLLVIDALHFEVSVQRIPRGGFVSMDDRALRDAIADEVERRAFRAENGRDRAAVASADDDDTLTLAVLVDGKTTIAAVLFEVGRLHVAAEVAAVDLDFLALATNNAALHFFGHRLAELMQEHESSLVGRAKFAGHSESVLALHFVAVEGDRREIYPQRELVRREERPARHREVLAALTATEARRAGRTAAVVGFHAPTMRANRLAVGLRPADLAEHGFRVRIRHAEDRTEGEGLSSAGEKEVLSHVTRSDDVMYRI